MHLITLTILFRSLADIFAKKAALASVGGGLFDMVFNTWLLMELLALMFQAIAWLFVLRRFELSIAYPFMGLTLGVNLLASWLIFNESILLNHVVGFFIIACGIGVIHYSKKN